MDKKTIEAAHAYYTAKVTLAPETRARGPVIDAHHAIQAFEAGAEWQREHGNDDAVMRMLGSIENRLMELAKGLSYHVEAQSGRHKAITGALVETQSIIQDVGQKVEAVLDQVTPEEPENHPLTSFVPIEEVVRLHREHYGKTGGKMEGPSFHFGEDLHIGSAQSRASKPVTDESGVSVGAGAGPLKDERDVRIKELEAERDDWHHAYDKLVSKMVHGSVLHVGVDLAKPGTDQTAITTHHHIDWKFDCLKACDEAGSYKARAERAERYWRFWRGIAKARQTRIAELDAMTEDLIKMQDDG